MRKTKIRIKISVKIVILFLLTVCFIVWRICTGFYKMNEVFAVSAYTTQAQNCLEYIDLNLSGAEKCEEWLSQGNEREVDYYVFTSMLDSMSKYFHMNSASGYKFLRDSEGNYTNDAVVIFNMDDPTLEHTESLIRNCDYYDLFITYSSEIEGDKSLIFDADNNIAYNNLSLKAEEKLNREEPIIGVKGINEEGRFVFEAVYPIRYLEEDNYLELYGLLTVELDMEEVISKAVTETSQIALVIIILFVLFAAWFLHYTSRRIVKNVTLLSKSMRDFVSERNGLNFEPVTGIKPRNEIHQMADEFNALAKDIIEYTKNLKEKTAVHEKLKFDTNIASSIRSYISADNTYPVFPGREEFDLCLSVKNTVKNKCSFCNCYLSPNDHLYIIIGEPVGSSLASLLLSMLAETEMRCYAEMGYAPYKIAMETNNQLCGLDKDDRGMTAGALIADIDLRSGVMRYVNAGMPQTIIKRSGEKYELEKTPIQFNLGEMRGVSFSESTVTLRQGYTVLFTSYGISEMRSESGERFTQARLCSEMNRISESVSTLDGMVAELDASLNEFRGNAEPELDTTIAAFRYFG